MYSNYLNPKCLLGVKPSLMLSQLKFIGLQSAIKQRFFLGTYVIKLMKGHKGPIPNITKFICCYSHLLYINFHIAIPTPKYIYIYI